MKGRARTQGKKQDKVKPFTQGLQITNNGAKWDAIQSSNLVKFGILSELFSNAASFKLNLYFALTSSNHLSSHFNSFHLLTPLQKVTQSSALQAKPCLPLHCRRKKPWRWEKQTHTDVSLLVEPFSWVFLWSPSPATAFVLFFGLLKCITWATPVTSRGTPSEVSIFSQRQRMVITSRDILRRQARRQAGIAEAKQ